MNIPVIKFFTTYRFQVEAFAYNDTYPSLSIASSSIPCSSDDSECYVEKQKKREKEREKKLEKERERTTVLFDDAEEETTTPKVSPKR